LLLTHFDPNKTIVVAADASKHGIGAVLSHRMPDGTEKAVEHASCAMNDAQRNYSQTEKEALALVFAVKKFHRMLYGRRFVLQTDHKPLLAIFGSKKGIPVYAASRLQRWALIMANYDFEIKYVGTEAFGKADVLSRLIADYRREDEEVVIAAVSAEMEEEIVAELNETLAKLPLTTKEIADATARDEELKEVVKRLQNGWPKHFPNEKLLAKASRFDLL
jgi:hypothetical protein